jgi:hypothetical protein
MTTKSHRQYAARVAHLVAQGGPKERLIPILFFHLKASLNDRNQRKY